MEFPFSRSACRVHGNPSQTPDSPLFKVQQLQKLGLRAISGAVWFEKQEGSLRAGGQCCKPRLLQEEQGWGGISLPSLPAWPCSAELTPEGQQHTRVPAGSLQLVMVTVTVTVMVTVTVLPTPRAQPRAARLGTGLECWPCNQHRLCARSYKSIWAPGSACWAAQCSASLLSYRLKSFRTHVNPPANAPGRRPAVYSCAWWLPAARPVRRGSSSRGVRRLAQRGHWERRAALQASSCSLWEAFWSCSAAETKCFSGSGLKTKQQQTYQ